MKSKIGEVTEISVSGEKWNNGRAGDIRDMFYNTLRNDVDDIVQISTFTLGKDNDEVNEFFSIIKDLLKSGRKVQLIVNDDGKSCSKYAKNKISRLKEQHPKNFSPYYYKSSNKTGILHAKLVVVDKNKFALVGSANISRYALALNHEVMLKVSGNAVADLSLLLDDLAENLQDESNA